MSYFRSSFRSLEEFQREGLASQDLWGHEESTLIREIESDDDWDVCPQTRRRSRKSWD